MQLLKIETTTHGCVGMAHIGRASFIKLVTRLNILLQVLKNRKTWKKKCYLEYDPT